MAISLVLLGSSASLAAVFEHDAIGVDYGAAAQAPVGEHVRLRGDLVPFPYRGNVADAGLRDSAGPLAVLDGLLPHEPFRFLLLADGMLFVVLSPQDHGAGTVILSGTVVAHVTATAGQFNGRAAVVRAEGWTVPILFR